MVSKSVAVALAFSSAAYAAPALHYRQDKCQDAYKACIAAGTPEVACSCTLTACLGEDNARNRDYCASATASLKQPSPTSIPGGCNPAHPGSCPSSYFSTLPSAPVTTSIPGGCNPAHPGSCPSSYFSTLSSTPVATSIPGGCNPAHPGSCPSSYFSTLPSSPVATSIPGGCNPAHPGSCPSSYFSTLPSTPVATSIPGGCNPAHPGSCPSSYFSTVVVQPTPTSIPGGCNPAHPGSCPTPSAAQAPAAAPSVKAAPGSNPTKEDGKTWTIANMTRYCGEGNTGCDYNFAIQTADKTERCTVIRMPGSNAATESWSNQPCTDGSDFTVSWGYAPNPAPAFAVVTVVKGKELAWFGVPDVNGQKVTPSNPFGSGQYGNLGPEQVYTY